MGEIESKPQHVDDKDGIQYEATKYLFPKILDNLDGKTTLDLQTINGKFNPVRIHCLDLAAVWGSHQDIVPAHLYTESVMLEKIRVYTLPDSSSKRIIEPSSILTRQKGHPEMPERSIRSFSPEVPLTAFPETDTCLSRNQLAGENICSKAFSSVFSRAFLIWNGQSYSSLREYLNLHFVSIANRYIRKIRIKASTGDEMNRCIWRYSGAGDTLVSLSTGRTDRGCHPD